MENAKNSFVFYLDNYPMLLALPPDQRGWVLSALCVYADRVWQDTTVTIAEIMELFPQLSPQARMACAFIGASILRDTKRWLNRRQIRQERRSSQNQGQGRGPNSPAESEREQEQVRLDMEQTRRLVERMKLEEEEPSAPGTR